MKKLGLLSAVLAGFVLAACSEGVMEPVVIAVPDMPSFHHSPPPSDFSLEASGTTLSTTWTAAGPGGDAQHYVVEFQACGSKDTASCSGSAHTSPELANTVGSYDWEDVDPGFYRARINAHDGGPPPGGPNWSDWTSIVEIASGVTWYFTGFYRPVSQDPDVMTRIRRGATAPLKFNVFEDEDLTEEITDVGELEAEFALTPVSCNGAAVDSDEGFETTGGTSLRYDNDAGQFVKNWQAPSRRGCYEVTLSTPGGDLSATFNVF